MILFLHLQELMGRPLRLKFSQKNVDEAGVEQEKDLSEGPQQEPSEGSQQEAPEGQQKEL